MRIVYIIDIIAGDHGGTESQLMKLINGIRKDEFETRLVCLDNSEWFQQYESRFETMSTVIEINKFRKPMAYYNFIKLVKFLKEYEPDIVHTYFPFSNIIGVFAARLAGIRNIVSSRRDYGEWMNWRYLFSTRIANRLVREIVANSNRVKKLTEKAENARDGKVKVIRNGVELEVFTGVRRDLTLKKRLNIPVNDKVVGIVANFRRMKNHDTFIKAAYEILKIRKDVSFVLVGEGPLKDEKEALGRRLGIADKLFFVGVQKEIRSHLSIMDVGVNCSEQEGLSNAIMEYMAAGVPCVVSNAGGNPDLITHNVNGYAFELDDYKTLASQVTELLNNRAKGEMFIGNARAKIQKEMNLDSMIRNYECLYQRLAEK